MTPKATRVKTELDLLVTEIEGQLLAFASAGARTEWTTFRENCSSARGDELDILVGKARRFREVLLLT
jgi:hypothetical protein